MNTAASLPLIDYPEFACQPICFKQDKFREDLLVKPKVQVFKDAIAGVNSKFEQRFIEGEDIRSLVYERSAFMDLILHYAWYQYTWNMDTDDIALAAVGGYGRGELHPYSDIDLLILLGDHAKNKYNDQIQTFITFLWDIGLEIGSSVRTISECVTIAKNDITVITNLTEARRLAGNNRLIEALFDAINPDKMWDTAAFFQAKLKEQSGRHKKHNNTEYNLEPNIKNAPGGLRDIQMINWVAKRFYGVRTLRQLEGKDFFTEHEFGVLHQCEELLWTVRYGVHVLAARAEERLLFEHQRELAKLFGYEDSELGLGVERFMAKYYRTALAMRELNDVLLQYIGEAINKNQKEKIIAINDRFQLRDNFIEVTRETIFDEFPGSLLEIFVLMGHNRDIQGVRASTIRLIRDKRWLVNDNFRNAPENKRMFMALFSIDYGLVTQLERMKRYGILGRYLPIFGDIIGQMQHDLFHRYTVDAHTLLVIKNMRRFRRPEEQQEFPVASHVMNNLPKQELLYLAGLFHDIGKGRGGDHSTLGAIDAMEFCLSHGLSNREAKLVAWLVEKHLLMSYVSQKQDISDPDIIRNFALQVGDQLHLDYLYALTVADMCGTNPEIWNSWRASLLRQLYMDTRRALRKGLEHTVDLNEVIEEKRRFALLKLADKGISESQSEVIWANMGDEYFVRESHNDIAWQTEALINHQTDTPLVLIRKSVTPSFEGATQIFIYTKDAQHVFMAVATCLAQLGLNIQDARIYNSTTGYTVDTFHVLNQNYEVLNDDPRFFQKIQTVLIEELSQIGNYTELVQKMTPRQLKQFAIPTRIELSNDIEGGRTVLQVISPDRPGLLATIAGIFMEQDIVMQNAKISTLGERVEDVFFITNTEGEPLSDAKKCMLLQQTICERLDQQAQEDVALRL